MHIRFHVLLMLMHPRGGGDLPALIPKGTCRQRRIATGDPVDPIGNRTSSTDLDRMVLAGNVGDASRFLSAIAEGLGRSRGILAEEAPDFIRDLSDHIAECARNKDFGNTFEWRRSLRPPLRGCPDGAPRPT